MLSPPDTDAILAADISISEKIRRLDAGGVKRADIARLLGKRYQHVRNVLEGEKLRSGHRLPEPPALRDQPMPAPRAAAPVSGFEEPAAEFAGVHRLVIGPDGAVQLPPNLLGREGWQPGRVVLAFFEDDRLVIETARAARMRAQALVCQVVGPGRSLVEELIEDRRREAEAERD